MPDIFFYDMYRTHPGLDMLSRFIVIATIFMNVVGIIMEIVKFRKHRNWISSAGVLALHIIPIIAFGSFFYWLLFGNWM